MPEPVKPQTAKIVGAIFVAAAVFIVVALSYKESHKKATAKPLHTPLPAPKSDAAPAK